MIKIIADDHSGGVYEISKTYNFRATDIDLGNLSIPYESNHNFAISANEPDFKVGFNFSITEETGISLNSATNLDYSLRDTNGNYMTSGYNNFYYESLPVGNYYIEIMTYSSNPVSGDFLLVLRNPKETDVDLGILTVPYEASHAFDATTEPDDYIGYSFSITENTGLFIKELGTMNYYQLTDSNGNWFGNGYDQLAFNSLDPGDYLLSVSNNQNPSANFTLLLQNPRLTDVALGELTPPYLEQHSFSIEEDELDNIVAYTFTLQETTGISLTSNAENYFYLKDSFGNYITGDYNNLKYGSLTPGEYAIEVEKNYSYTSGDFVLVLQEDNYTDQNLGLIDPLPYSASFDMSILNNEPDSKILYQVELNQETGYSFSTNIDAYVGLLDSNKNYVNSNYQNLSGNISANGVYYIEIYYYYGNQFSTGSFTIDFD